MIDPSALSDEQQPSFRIDRQGGDEPDGIPMGPAVPDEASQFQADVTLAEQGDPDAAQRVLSNLSGMTVPVRERADLRRRIQPGLQAGLMRQAQKAPIEPERWKPRWVGNKMHDMSILRLQDTIGFAEGGIHNSGRFMSPTERAFSEDNQSAGRAGEMLLMRMFDPNDFQEMAAFLEPGFKFVQTIEDAATQSNAMAYINPLVWAQALQDTLALPDQETRLKALQSQTDVARNDLRYVDEVIIPNLIDAWDTGLYTPAQLRDAVRRTGLRPDNALGRRIDNMRYQRHISAKPDGVDGSQWRARFKPLAPNFKTEAEGLRDSAAQMGQVGVFEELPSAALGALGMFGDVAENLTLSGLQDDYKQLAQLIRDGKPVPEDLADRIVAFELQEARPRTKAAKHVGEFADSFGYVLDMWLGDKLLKKIPGLDKLAKKFPKSIGQIARGFGMTDDALIAAAKEASPLWRNAGNKLMGIRTDIALGGARGAAVTGSVARGLGQAAAATGASTVLQAGASLVDRGDLSITRVGMPGMTALERSMREEVMVGINPDTMQPTFTVSETAVSDSPTAADFFSTASEFVSEHLGRYLPLVGSDMTPNARRMALANAMSGTMGAATRNRFVRALSGASDAVPIGGILEEHAEEVVKRGLDKFAGVLTGNEQLSETEVLGGMAEMVDEFERVALNTSLMRAGRAGKDRLSQRRSSRQRAQMVDGLIRDVQNMDNDPEAAARVQKYLDRSRTPDPEVIGEVVAGIEGADFVDLETLSDEARSALNHFASTYGVTIVPMQGAVSEEGLFSDKTPGVIYLSVDTLNDEGKLSEATPKILQEVAMHELEHDAQFLLGDLWGPLAEGMKAQHPEVWEAATKRYKARTPGFDELSPEVQDQEAASQIAQDNAILVDALLNDPQVGRLLAEMDAGGEMSPMERIQHGLRRLVTFDLSGRRSRDRAARVLRDKIGFEGTSAEAAAAYDISEMLRDVMAIRGAVRINQSLGRHAGILGVSDNEYVDPSPEIMRRIELERQRMGAPLSEIPAGGLYMPANLYPALDQQEAPAQDFDVQPFDNMRQEATERAAARVAAEDEREATASARADAQLDTEVARAEEVYNQRVEAAEQEYSRDQEGRTPGQEQRAVERYDQQVLEATNEYNAEVDAINERRDEAQRVIEREAQSRRDSDPEIGALAAEFANIQEQEDQARAEASRPIPQRPLFIPFGESVLQPPLDAPQPTQALPTAEDTAQLLEEDTPEGAEARAERDAQQEAQRERTDAAARGEAQLQRNIQEVLPGDRIRIRQSSPAYDPTIGRLQQQEGGFEVLEVTGPEGQQRIRIQVPGESMSTVIPADQVRKLRGEQTMPTTEGTREAIEQTREDARTGRVRFSPRRDGSDANGVVPVIKGAERNKNFQKFVRRTKVRDDKGKPLVVYHGTTSPNDFSKFDRTSDIGYHFGTQEQAQSARFIGWAAKEGRSDADYYDWQQSRSARVYPVYLDIRNPLIMPDLGSWPAKAVVNVLQNLSGKDAKAYAADYARSSGVPMPDRLLKAFKPIPVSVVEDIIDALDTFDGNKWEEPQARVMRVAYNEIIRKHLQNAGYDGIAYINEAEGDKPAPSYITFSSHQVKSIHNQGTFDATNPDIRRSPRPRPMNPVDSFDLPEMTGWERFRSNYEDRFLRVQQFEQWLKSTHGVEVHGDQSPASLMKRYPGRLRARHQDITDNFETPLIKLMVDNDLSVERVEQFLMAKHTEEANESLAERRRLAPVLRDEAFAARQEARSLTGADRQKKLQEAKFKEAQADRIDNPEGAVSYYTNERAAEILREMEASPDFAALEEVAQIVYNMNEQTRDMLREGRLISQAQRDDWRRFDFYVPMRSHEVHNTWAETRGFQDAKPVSYVRKGRSEEGSVPNPLIFSFQQARSAINRAHKNIIGNRLVDLVERAGQAEVMPADISGPRPDFNAPENLASFTFKRDGEQIMVKFKDVDLALAIKGMDMPELAAWEQRWQQATRAIADFNTQYTPEFFISNAIRDAIGASVMAGEFRDAGYDIKRRRIAADTIGFLKAQLKPGSNTDFDAVIREYKDAGGQIGWSDATDFETIQSDINKKLKRLTASRASRGARKMLYAYPELMSKLNLAMEQATRLAVFRSMRLAGATPAKAAEAARDITVDFNRRGHKSGFLNRAYMFFNAGVQGNARAARAFLRSKEVQAAAGGGVVLGFFMDMFMAAGSGEDEDGRLEWDNTDSYTRYNHLHVPGSNVKVPLPYGWNLFPALGQALGRLHRGVIKPEQVYGELGRMVFDTLSPVSIPEFTPEGLAVGLTPSVPRPLAEIVANLDYRGIPIYSEPFPGTLDLDSKQDQDSAYAGITTAIYELTGGKPADAPGALLPIDINPNAMGHVIEGIFGGTLRFAEKLLQADDWSDTDKRPLVRRVYKRPNPYGVQGNFFDLREESNMKVNARKLALEEGDTEEVRRIDSEYGSFIAVNDDLRRAYEEAKPLLEAASQAEDFATREVYRKKADQVMGQVIRRFDRLERTKQL